MTATHFGRILQKKMLIMISGFVLKFPMQNILRGMFCHLKLPKVENMFVVLGTK